MTGSDPISSLASLSPWALAALATLAVCALALVVFALIDLSRRTDAQVVGGRRWVWLLVILFVNSGIGAIIYLAAGRRPAAAEPARPVATDAAAAAVDALYGPPEDSGPR